MGGIHGVSVNWVPPRYKRLGRDVRLLYFFSGRREAHKMPGIDCLNKRRIRFILAGKWWGIATLYLNYAGKQLTLRYSMPFIACFYHALPLGLSPPYSFKK